MKKNSTMNYLTQNIRNNNISLKNRPLLNKEINSLSISKRSEKASENFFLLQNSSQEKDHLSEQRVIGSLSNSSFKQHLQMKALKSLIKTKYGSIPQNFLTVIKSLYTNKIKSLLTYRFLEISIKKMTLS